MVHVFTKGNCYKKMNAIAFLIVMDSDICKLKTNLLYYSEGDEAKNIENFRKAIMSIYCVFRRTITG